MSAEAQTPKLAEVIRNAVRQAVEGVHVCIPGKIEKYDSAQNRADVKPLIKVGRTSHKTGEREVSSIPVVTEVPVVFPGSGGVRLKFPITKGDSGLLLFSEASLDLWLQRGGEVDPGDDRRNNLSDGIFIPGLQDFKSAGNNAPMIDITSTKVKLGENAIYHLLLAETFLAAHATLIGAIATAAAGTGGGVTTAINTALATFQAAAASYTSIVGQSE